MGRKKEDSYGALELAKDVIISNNNKALSAAEIWEKATEEQKKHVNMKTKNPAQDIYCVLYNDIRSHSDSEFVGVGRNPIKWQMKFQVLEVSVAMYRERGLHRILSSYIGMDSNCSSCYCKTVYQESSARKEMGINHRSHSHGDELSYPFEKKGSNEIQMVYERTVLTFPGYNF